MSRPIYARVLRIVVPVLFAAATAAPAAAATRVWPVLIGPGCNGTLQQCIDTAIAGDIVRIVSDDIFVTDAYTAIDEDVVINKSLTLEASPGIDAVFLPGRTVVVDSPTTGALAVTLRRLVIRAGSVRVTHRSTADSTYTLDQMRIDEAAGETGDCAIRFEDAGAGSPSFVLGDSTLRFRNARPLTPSAVCAQGQGGPWRVSFFRNRIDSENGAVSAGMAIGGTSSGTVTVAGNQLFVFGSVRGLVVSQNVGSTANVLRIHDNVVTGQSSPASSTEAAIRASLTNTDVRVVNNTVVRNTTGITVGGFGTATSSGRVANNIVAFNSTGLVVSVTLPAIANEDNLVSGNTFDGFTPGPGTIAVDPQFVSMYDYRLLPTSPARDSGRNADVETLFGVAFDGDGERRIVDGTVDIGAFESNGDQSIRHLATVANTFGNSTELDALRSVGATGNVLLTPLRGSVTGSELEQNLGVFQQPDATGYYYLAFHENTGVSVSPGRSIAAFVPSRGATGFLHTTTLGSVVDQYSRITNPELDSRPAAIAFVTHNWNPGGSGGTYHNYRLGLDYVAPNWYVSNQDGTPMQSGRAFNIVVAPLGSPNAFVRPVGTSARAELRLEHPLLDDSECAAPQASRSGATPNNTAFSLEYRAGGLGAPGHWFIVAEGAGSPTFPANAAFNVMVPGAQANSCSTNRLFSDGFE